MKLDHNYITGYLSAIAEMGSGCDHGNSFYCEPIVFDPCLMEALKSHYYNNVYCLTGPDFTDKEMGGWKIDICRSITKEVFSKKIEHYFFNMEFSPKLGSRDGRTRDTTGEFVERFLGVIDEKSENELYSLHHVEAYSDVVFYDLEYDDFVLDYGSEYYLLHLGWSD